MPSMPVLKRLPWSVNATSAAWQEAQDCVLLPDKPLVVEQEAAQVAHLPR